MSVSQHVNLVSLSQELIPVQSPKASGEVASSGLPVPATQAGTVGRAGLLRRSCGGRIDEYIREGKVFTNM